MKKSFIQELFAQRIGGHLFGGDTVLYKFERIKQAKRAAIKNNPGTELIDLGVGEPDWMAERAVVEILYEQAGLKENRGYTDNGIQEFKDAAGRYLESVYQVKGLNPVSEVNHGTGSKSILTQLPLAFY